MKKKSLLVLASATLFAVAGAVLIANNTSVLPNSRLTLSQKKAAVNDYWSWEGYIDGMTEGEFIGAKSDGYHLKVDSARSTDYQVKLGNYHVTFELYKTYEIEVEMTSTVASDPGKGAVIVVNNNALWTRKDVVAGSNTFVSHFNATQTEHEVLIQLGELGIGEFVIESIKITEVKNVMTSFIPKKGDAYSEGYGNWVVHDHTESPKKATFGVNHFYAEEEGTDYKSKLLVFTDANLEKDVEYEIQYDVKSNVTISQNINIVHGVYNTENPLSVDPEDDAEFDYSAYVEKWNIGYDGHYEVHFTAGEKQHFEFKITPTANLPRIVLTIQMGRYKGKADIEISNIRFTKTSDYKQESPTYHVSLGDSFTSWKAAWDDVRNNHDIYTYDLTELIARYDALAPSEKAIAATTQEVTTYACTYAAAVEYFRNLHN